MTRIMHVVNGLGGGGKERRLIQLIKGLYTIGGYKQSLVAMNAKNDYQGQFEHCVDYIVVNAVSKKAWMCQLSSIIKKQKPDIVHLWETSPTLTFLLPVLRFRYGFKCVAGFISESHPIKRFSYRSFCHHYAFFFSDAIVSNSWACLASKHAIYKKSHVIHNGFDFGRFDAPGFDRSEFRFQLGLNDTQFVATMVARFTPQKDFSMLVDVAEKVKDLKDIVFLTVGKGELLEQIQAICAEKGLDCVKFLGFRSDVEKILMCSDIGLLFTNSKVHAEGISNSIMESMAAGLPVIATDGGGTPEIIEDKKSGFIVAPGDSEAAATMVRRLYSDEGLRKEIGNNAKARIKSDFTLDSMTEKYRQFYNSLLLL